MSRKGRTNITHLLNWNVPRPQVQHSSGGSRPYSRKTPTWGVGSGYHVQDKARYVNANYRFVVNPLGDYRAQAVDPDVFVPWDHILQVVASAESQNSSCPICLCDTVAPRMARCGHIFCLPCLLRYMAASEEPDKNAAARPAHEKKARWKKCPICWDSIYMKDTKPVRWFIGQEAPPPREGGDVVLRLVMRRAGSTLALPKEGASVPKELEDIPWHFAAEVMDYARLMKGTRKYMLEQYGAEISNLQRTQKEDELMFGEEGEWTRKAVAAIRYVIESLDLIDDSAAPEEEKIQPKPARPQIEFRAETDEIPDMYLISQQKATSKALLVRSATSESTVQTSEVKSEVKLGQASEDKSEEKEEEKPEEKAEEKPGEKAEEKTEEKTEEKAGERAGERADGAVKEAEISSVDQAADTPKAPGNHRTHQNHHFQRAPDAPFYFYQALPHYYLSPLDIKILKTEFGDFSAFPATILPRVENVSTGHTVDHELRRRTRYLSHLPAGCEVSFLECDWTDTVSPAVLEQFKTEINSRRDRKRTKEAREERERIRAEKAEYEERWLTYRTARRRDSISSSNGMGETLSQNDFVPLAASRSDAPMGSSPPYEGRGFGALSSTSPDQGSAHLTVWGTRQIGSSDGGDQGHRDDGWADDWEARLIEEEIMAHEAFDDKYGSTSGRAPAAGKSNQKKKGKKKMVTLMTNGGKRGA
ncbi:hypothetical protein BJ508DRAFT_80691 [Ascobolus immersus RN42]|uniref:RING-type domain-containing protein n=1 Tax=Ascobolus immersus RN42 TaxID=1160509 RepID=A0A3N4IFE2_ASCIM|nr:hypothetical protein BJ508DRAFT_80691 [Ascobolus immersus RN42]